MNIAPGKRNPVLLQDASAQDRAWSERHRAWLERLAGLASIRVLEAGERAPPPAAAPVGTLTGLVPMAGLLHAAAEDDGPRRLLAKTRDDLLKVQAPLAHARLVRNPPAAVVSRPR